MQKKIRLKTINDYIEFLSIVDNKFEFNMNIIRDGLYEIQTVRDSFLREGGLLNTNEDEIAIMLLIYTRCLEDRDALVKRFEDSHIYQKANKLDEKKLKDRYVLKINKDWNLLRETLNHITYDIYKYESNEVYKVEFFKIENNQSHIISGIKINYIDYFFNRSKWKVFSNIK